MAERLRWLCLAAATIACTPDTAPSPRAPAPASAATSTVATSSATTAPPLERATPGAPSSDEPPDPVPIRPAPDGGALVDPGHDSDGDGVSDARDGCPEVAGVDSVDTTRAGCPVRPGRSLAAPSTLRIEARIEFASGASAVPPAARSLLDEVVTLLDRSPELELEIVGHVDAMEPDDLSLLRARAVRDAIAARGIAPTRLSATGEGSRRPIASNATSEGRARNRRVEFVTRGTRRPLDAH